MKRRTVVVGAVATGAGAGAAWWVKRSPAGDDPGLQRLWARRFEQPSGGELAMASLRGRPLVVNFWATWCPPCVKELPALDRFHREQGERGWRVVALAIDGAAQVRAFLERVPVSMPVGLAEPGGTDLLRELGNAQGGLPFTVMISVSEKVVWSRLGETNLEDLRREATRNSG